MKNELSAINVKRIGFSPYFKDNFLKLEKESINKISGVNYLDKDDNSSNVDVLITNTHVKLTLDKLFQYKDVKLIVHSNSGYDNFTHNFVKEFEGQIILGNEIRANAVTQFILSSLFEHFNKINSEKSWSNSRKWDRILLNEKTILILGYGHIGKKLHAILGNLAKEVRIYDPFLNFKELNLKNVDVVIPICGLNPTSLHLINDHFLKSINKDFLIINAARGELINTPHLIHALEKNKNAFAYLDVFEKEPNDFSEFKHLTNIVTTSHIAGVFTNIDKATVDFEADIISDFVKLEMNHFQFKYQNANLKNKIHDEYLI